MISTKKIWLVSLVLVIGICLFGSQSFADILRRNQVPNLTTATLDTVPSGEVFLLKSAVISKTSTSSACCQRIYRGGTAVTGFISIRGRDSTQITFDPPIVYRAGETIQVRNGASSGPTSFTLIGTFVR